MRKIANELILVDFRRVSSSALVFGEKKDLGPIRDITLITDSLTKGLITKSKVEELIWDKM